VLRRTRDSDRGEVEPRASKKGISGVLGSTVKVKLTAPPVGGAANEQLIEVLAERPASENQISGY
jgi:uncharacterized protein YggU (UPF0235/DUF167 family)